MGLIDNVFERLGYIRLRNGSHTYRTLSPKFTADAKLMESALSNPVAYACIEIRAKTLAQVQFLVEDGQGNKTPDHPIVELLENPNKLQSKEDFLKQFEWFKTTYGWVYQRPYGATGGDVSAIFNLNPIHVEFPKTIMSTLTWTEDDVTSFFKQKITYDDGHNNKDIELQDLVMFFDTGNAINMKRDKADNPLVSPSRMLSIVKSLSNVELALDAENVMIQTNGREIFSGGAERGTNLGAALPMEDDDKDEIERRFIQDYGVGGLKKRTIATNQQINWQSLHIKLKDLGLHESISSNANIIREVFEVPNELYKAFQKGSTYENQKEALISFIQRTMQPIADDMAGSLTDLFIAKGQLKEGERLIASYAHLPVMQHTEEKKAEKVLKIATAMYRLTQAGMSAEESREFVISQGVNFEE